MKKYIPTHMNIYTHLCEYIPTYMKVYHRKVKPEAPGLSATRDVRQGPEGTRDVRRGWRGLGTSAGAGGVTRPRRNGRRRKGKRVRIVPPTK